MSVVGKQMRPSTSVLAHGKTDKEGRFRFEGIPTDYIWQFTSNGQQPSHPFIFSEPGVYRVTIQLVADGRHDTGVLRITSMIDPQGNNSQGRLIGTARAQEAIGKSDEGLRVRATPATITTQPGELRPLSHDVTACSLDGPRTDEVSLAPKGSVLHPLGMGLEV